MSYILRVLTVFGFVWGASGAAAQAPDPQMVSTARGDVGFVIATQCSDGNDRSGTAFVWPQADQVITARHVVAGCRSISVQFRNHGRFNATPIREIRAQDVIALRLDNSTGATVQTLTQTAPPVHSKVAVVGFALGAPTADDKLLTVTSGNLPPPARLKQLLPDAERRLIQNNGPWDLETAIIRLDGNLTHGHSGAPVFDHRGQVVAIGAGGLQSGASGIVWAVNASYLLNTANWSAIAQGQVINPENALTFSVQPPQARLEQVRCGDFTLSLSRTIPFEEIAAASDDQNGLNQVVNAVSAGLPFNFNGYLFDIWEDLQSGAVVPLPTGRKPRSGQGGCTAEVGYGINIWIRSYDGSRNPADRRQMNDTVWQFRSDIGNWIGNNIEDQQFTYRFPIARPDGFVATREGRVGPQIAIDGSTGYQNYSFVTHVDRGGYYLGVGAVRTGSVIDYFALDQCKRFGYNDACSYALPPLFDWAMAALSVHMSTMPPI